jgi:hypothetical protein
MRRRPAAQNQYRDAAGDSLPDPKFLFEGGVRYKLERWGVATVLDAGSLEDGLHHAVVVPVQPASGN